MLFIKWKILINITETIEQLRTGVRVSALEAAEEICQTTMITNTIISSLKPIKVVIKRNKQTENL